MILADLLLLMTAAIWGAAFAVVKGTLNSMPPGLLVAVRYTASTILTALVFRRHLKSLSPADFKRGAFTGVLLALAYLIQTTGLHGTTAGKNAFLTTCYVILVPLISWLLLGKRPGRGTWPAALLMLLGIGLLSLGAKDGGGLNRGDCLTLMCSVFFALHILAIERNQKQTDVYALIVLQFGFCAAAAFIWHYLFEKGSPVSIGSGSLLSLVYLSVFSSTIGMSLQNIGQSMAPSEHAVILLSMESVFGALSGVVFLKERITPVMGLGFAVIFMALVICETAQTGHSQNAT